MVMRPGPAQSHVGQILHFPAESGSSTASRSRKSRYLRSRLSRPPRFAPRTAAARAGSSALLSIRSAMGERRELRLRYQNEKGEESERVVRPLGAFLWGKSWTVAAWCELRNDFRDFRLDRIVDLTATEENFERKSSIPLGAWVSGSRTSADNGSPFPTSTPMPQKFFFGKRSFDSSNNKNSSRTSA